MTAWRGLQQNVYLHWQRSPLAQRWHTLPPRDRLALVVLGGFLLLVLGYLSLWQPAQRQAQVARAAFEEQRALYAYLQSRAPELRGRDLQAHSNIDPARLQGLVTASAAEQGVVIERMDSDGEGAVQVGLQPVPFGQLLRWIQSLERQGVSVQEAGIDRGEDNRVVARMGLRAGS